MLGSGNTSSKGGGGEAKVHQGWLSVYTSSDPRSKYNKESARKQVITSLNFHGNLHFLMCVYTYVQIYITFKYIYSFLRTKI